MVASGILPAVEGGILAARTGVDSGSVNGTSNLSQNITALPAGLEARLHVTQDG